MAEAESKVCFVVMPFGRDVVEQRWYRGWYEVVLQPAIASAGYAPFLSAASDSPDAINDEIRRHLAFDPMVVVDVGGINPDEPPNPNVMYELGLRHAFGLPLVLLAWDGQRLPFDISNQRAICCRRDLLDIEPTKSRLKSFILAAADGHYYNPMIAVGRKAALEVASNQLGDDSILKTLIGEIEDLRRDLPTKKYVEKEKVAVRDYLSRRRVERLISRLPEYGVPPHLWDRLVEQNVPASLRTDASMWDDDSWMEFLRSQAIRISRVDASDLTATGSFAPGTFAPDADTIEKVAHLLPTQPWPKNIHKLVAARLGISNALVSRAINELIKQRRFLPQIQGVVYAPRDGDGTDA